MWPALRPPGQCFPLGHTVFPYFLLLGLLACSVYLYFVKRWHYAGARLTVSEHDDLLQIYRLVMHDEDGEGGVSREDMDALIYVEDQQHSVIQAIKEAFLLWGRQRNVRPRSRRALAIADAFPLGAGAGPRCRC